MQIYYNGGKDASGKLFHKFWYRYNPIMKRVECCRGEGAKWKYSFYNTWSETRLSETMQMVNYVGDELGIDPDLLVDEVF